MPLVLAAEEEEQTLSPILSTEDGVNFLYVKHNNLYCILYIFNYILLF